MTKNLTEHKSSLAAFDVLFDANQLQSISQKILDEAVRAGASQAEVGVGASKGFSVGVHNGDVETVQYHQDKMIDITVYFGKRRGAASISDMRPDAIRDAVAAACHIAKFTDEDPCAGLADPHELAFHYPQLESAYPWDITVEKAIQMAIDCEREAVAQDKRIMSAEECSLVTGEALDVYANSHGFMGTFAHTRHELSCVLVAKQDDEMQRDYGYTISADPAHLESVSYVAKLAAERTVRRLGARRLPTMKAPVIFIAEQARSLLGHFASAIAGGNLYRKSSFLVDHLGKKIFPDFMHLQEQPHLPRSLGSAPFDGDGVLTRPNIFIEDGYLRNYALSVYSARKLAMKTTGNCGGLHNLIVRLGDKNLAQLLKSMNKGLLITELMGSGVNLMTGDYSRGAAGFWIEKGEIQYPVHEITIAGTLQQMYGNLVEVANDVDLRGNIRTGSILLDEMMIAGS